MPEMPDRPKSVGALLLCALDERIYLRLSPAEAKELYDYIRTLEDLVPEEAFDGS